MSEPFIGTIQAFGFNFAPRGWALCQGQLLAVSGNEALFSLLGTFYGGDGRTSFGIPDLRGRVMVNNGSGPGLTPRSIGEKYGLEQTTLNLLQMPQHTHTATASGSSTIKASSSVGTSTSPSSRNNVLSASAGSNIYSSSTPNTDLNTGTGSESTVSIGESGGGQAFSINQPTLAVNMSIALLGLYPSRN